MSRTPRTTPETLVRIEEQRAEEVLKRERDLNRVIERRNPTLPSTEAYARGVIPSSDPRWYTKAQYTTYLGRREMGRFDPNVTYPTPPPPRRATPAKPKPKKR